MNYGKLLGRLMEKGFTQAELAEEIGISAVTLNKKLRGYSEFTQSEITAICEKLNIPDGEIPAYFFTANLKKS